MVGYHNTLPFLYGLEARKGDYDLILDVPSRCLSYFDERQADVALVPIGALLEHTEYKVITDYCIGCVGAVETVCIYAHQPIHTLKKIYLDSDSRTSQILTKILCTHHWNVDVEFEEREVRSLTADQIKSGEGALMIGDKAFGAEDYYEYVYDLGHEWQLMTDLPFAFAVWIARPDLPESEIEKLNAALSVGVEDLELVLSQHRDLDREVDLRAYFEQYIEYHYDDDKKTAHTKYRDYWQVMQTALVEH